MKNFLLLFFFFLSADVVLSQTVLIDENVKQDEPTNIGPNKKRFGHYYIGFGSIFGKPENDSLSITTLGSYEFTFGYRVKYMVSQLYSLGFSVNYNAKIYRIKQDTFKLYPNRITHEWEKLQLKNLSLDIYNRFNYGKRGNYIGKFIDIGAYADWSFNPAYVSYDKYVVANSAGASNTKQVHKGLVYTNSFNYGLNMRIGFNQLVFFGSYRLSDIFKSGYIYTELPRIIAGIQLGLHK